MNRMRWVWHVACEKKNRNAFRILVDENLKDLKLLERTSHE